VNNIFKILLVFIFLTNCSFNKNSSFWKTEKIKKVELPQKEEIIKKEKKFSSEFNTKVKISLYAKAVNDSFLNNLDNNNGRINFNGNLEKISKYKFSAIKKFHQYDPEILFYKNDIIFFDNKGTIMRFNNDSELVWKKNNYTKPEKKQNPILFFAISKKILIVADNIAKYYALDIDTGEVLWSKNNTAPFNSELKVYKDRFFIIDYQDILRAYSIKDSKEIWNVKTDNSLIRTQKKLSMVIVKDKIYFNNSLGDISAVDVKSGELLWQNPTQSKLTFDESFFLKTSDIIADKQTLYFSNDKNQFFSLDIKTGSINWKQKINSVLRPTLIDNYLFTISLDGFLFVIDKNSGNIIRITNLLKKFKPKQKNKIKFTGFIVGNENIYISTNYGRLFIAEISTGQIKSIIKIDKNKISRPFILNQKLIVITDNSIIKLN
jgi:outer membrane protein assembly factor BamB